MEIGQLYLRAGGKAAAVSPHDTNDLAAPAVSLWIGVAGDLCVIPVSQTASVTYTNVPVGLFDAVVVKRVLDTGTDADEIVANFGQ